MRKLDKPVIGLTMGDVAGIGPEIIIKALMDKEITKLCIPVVIGDLNVLIETDKYVKSGLKFRKLSNLENFEVDDVVGCIDLNLFPDGFPRGIVSKAAGNAAFRYLEVAIKLAKEKKIDAICTAPLNKEALHKAGFFYPGHTEILAELTGTKDYSMMLSTGKLNVIHVTTHIGLIDAINMINPKRVYRTIKLANDTFIKAGLQRPRIAVCGINPHAGENGLFGYGEEEDKIIPAINEAKKEGINVYGPLPADTIFYRANRGDFDVVVAMYHDQGHGPVKVLGLEGVNITVGLQIVRTSVDHGTAFDIAGKNIADELSMITAIKKAIELAPTKQ